MFRWGNETEEFCALGPGHPQLGGGKCGLAAPEIGLTRGKMELSHLVVGETPGGWEQSFVVAPVNLTTKPYPLMCGFPKSFSPDSVEEPYFHQQHTHTY